MSGAFVGTSADQRTMDVTVRTEELDELEPAVAGPTPASQARG